MIEPAAEKRLFSSSNPGTKHKDVSKEEKSNCVVIVN